MTNTKRILLLCLMLVAPTAALAGLPLTQSTTYIPMSPPPIKAQDLNDLQKYLAGLYSAVYSVKALLVDGTGGVTAAGPVGTVTVTTPMGSFNGSAPYNTGSLPWGSMAKENILLCGARCAVAAGSLAGCGGPNIRSVVRNGLGDYTVTCDTAGPNALRHFATVSPVDSTTSPVLATVITTALVSSGFSIRVHFFNLAGGDVDPTAFMMIAFGG